MTRPASCTPPASAGSTPASAGNRSTASTCNALAACLSRVPGQLARTVLRGPRRETARGYPALSHDPLKTHASFDDPNLVSQAGLVPVMALAERAGLADLVAEHVRPGGECGVNAHLKVACLVAGMAAGADSIDDMGLLRHGAMRGCSAGSGRRPRWARTCAATTGGTSRQLEKAGREFLAELARRAPLLPGAGTLAFIDIDSMQKRVYGYPANNWSA